MGCAVIHDDVCIIGVCCKYPALPQLMRDKGCERFSAAVSANASSKSGAMMGRSQLGITGLPLRASESAFWYGASSVRRLLKLLRNPRRMVILVRRSFRTPRTVSPPSVTKAPTKTPKKPISSFGVNPSIYFTYIRMSWINHYNTAEADSAATRTIRAEDRSELACRNSIKMLR